MLTEGFFPELLANVDVVTTYSSRGYQPAHAQINPSANSEAYYWMTAAGILQPLPRCICYVAALVLAGSVVG
jgi:hypothetical protein